LIKYVSKKFLSMFVSLFVLASATFFLMKIIPGDPFIREKAIPEKIREHLLQMYGLDQPVWKQYLMYLNNLLHGDLGMSMKQQYMSVTRIICACIVTSSAVVGSSAIRSDGLHASAIAIIAR